MNVRITYYFNHTSIVFCQLGGSWSWAATYDLFKQIEQFTAGNTEPYSIIFDVRTMTGFSSRQFFSHARYLVTHMPPSFSGTVAVVGAGDLIRTLVNAVRILHPRLFVRTHAVFADTVEEAFQLITQGSPH
jgi:hypothetical protein